MTDNEMNGNSIFPANTNKIFENILVKPSQSIADTLNDIWYLVLGGNIEYKVKKRKLDYEVALEKYKKEIENEINRIPLERYKDADIHLVGQILNESKFCVEKEEIRKMFSKLIAASMDNDKTPYLSYAFPSIINCLTSDEARLLKKLYDLYLGKETNRFESIDIRWIAEENIKSINTGFNMIAIAYDNTVEIRSIDIENDKLKTGATIYRNINLLGLDANCDYPENISIYLENLCRLGLILIENRGIIANDKYLEIIKSSFVKKLILTSNIEKDYHCYSKYKFFSFEKKYICISNFGLHFLRCCI